MDKLPQPFWANLLALQGTVLCIFVLAFPSRENLALAVIAVASNLVSGALGAFAGHAAAMQKIHPDPTTPATPAQP